MRLNQYIASATELSRRKADETIQDGRVKINGEPVSLGQQVGTDDIVTLDDRVLKLPETSIYIMFHKPTGVVVSRAHQDKTPTIYDVLPREYQNLMAVGRLDKDSSGLLLLTNDGQFTQLATHPSHEKLKTYEITLNRQFAQNDTDHLQTGVELEDGLSQLIIDTQEGKTLTVSLREGRNRQIRRTFEALGYRVISLHRVKFGPYRLDSLSVGECIEVDGKVL